MITQPITIPPDKYFTRLGVVNSNLIGAARTFNESWASGSATNFGQLGTLLFSAVESTGRNSLARIIFAPHPNLAAIRLLQRWIYEDQDALSPTLAEEMADLSAARLHLGER
jgi:hypothetical protein